ncbi:MAG: RidA family protein [Desulfocapsa sp.]|nr:RidA family protein [Desulfocapsa sp.]
MSRKIIQTDKAPGAVGPYSQGTRTEELLFTAGQIPLDPTTGKLVEGGIQEQTRQSLKNLQAVLEAGGAGLETVMKSTVFLQDMGEFSLMNEVYGEFFVDNPPARSVVEVAALPLGVRVEIEAIALIK